MAVTSATSTQLFVGAADAPRQVVRVTYTGADGSTEVAVDGDGLAGRAALDARGDGVVEVPVRVTDPRSGRTRRAAVHAGARRLEFGFTDAEPGWTVHMVSHFHYDPVWWNTQGAYTSEWTENPPGGARQTNGFELVAAHLEMARREPEYKFVLAEVDYLKPYWDTRPEDRDDLRRFLAEGRVEIMGGTYNEPNTNLTCAETAIRNFVHGSGFQRHVLGADPATAWQLDVFGHDPQFPGMAAEAGLTSSSWARGPHHQWGPMADGGDPRRMQFASEFEWIAPSGVGLLTHYMPAHYSAGWWMDSSASLAEAEDAVYALFEGLKKVAATRNVLLPVGTDYTPPNKWVTAIQRDWNARYTWPRFVCALPREFFAAVRHELAGRGVAPAPQTRDMNPIYTGKDVSFIDTKQANRAAEAAVLDAERFATFAHLLTGAEYPEAALAKAWVQLAYGAHHDAITGSESDQVYLDLLTGWRDAFELGRRIRDDALTRLATAVGESAVTVWNPLAHHRTDIVTVRLPEPVGPGVRVLDDNGDPVAALVEDDGRTLTWRTDDVPSLGWRGYRVEAAPAADGGWEPVSGVDGVEIANTHYRIRLDPGRGGGIASLRRAGRELVAPGRVANELAVYEEYPAHPKAGEGPWHLLPRGPVVTSAQHPAEVRAYRSPVGRRLVVRGDVGGLLRYTQTLTLWDGVDRIDCRTVIDDFDGQDRLVRLRWPVPVPGAMPVCEVGDAVVGRGFGLLHEPGTARSVDTAEHPWTLETPAFGWFGLSSAARIRLNDNQIRAVSVAEVVTPDESESAPLARELLVALVRAGVTATCSAADRPRYGHLDVDSNLPDVRLALGGPGRNRFTAAVLAAAGTAYTDELDRQLRTGGTATLYVPAAAMLAAEWIPDADLRDVLALPVLIVAGTDDTALRDAIAAVTEDLDNAEIAVRQRVPGGKLPFDDRTVALLNRGVPSFAVDTDGTLHTSLMRSCSGWPSGVWTTHERRSAPDGTNFQLQHWTHTFDHAVIAGDGDWRRVDLARRSAEFSHPLLTHLGAGTATPPEPGSLLRIEGDGVHVDAVKMAGNPTAEASCTRTGGRLATLRLVERHGGATAVKLDSDVAAVTPVAKTDLLEHHRRPGGAEIDLHGYEIATVLTEFTPLRTVSGALAGPAPHAETAQPLYARYWLHNRGPAPMGGLPAVAHLHPQHLHLPEPPDSAVLRLTVAADCADTALSGTIGLVCPPGWSADPDELTFHLDPGGYREADVTIAVPSGVRPGRYPVRAQLTLTGDLPPSWRQTVEDVCVIEVGIEVGETAGALLRLLDEPRKVVLSPGDTGRLGATIGSGARADLAAEAHLIAPWDIWEWARPAVIGAVLPASGELRLDYTLAPPPGTPPGQWWALIRVAAAGQLLYTPAVAVVIR
ncbi:glycoside hydrolase family 38 N-terminal domain-containing protein [Mycolicibacterium palauense]|uniref:glycoside hydrolase family 38 N-terminal domain-containing protein n=1 Tax=Mycolicibacterium palauense TaxID=2034511 RepID=UPI000BFEC751|nr:NEW3 domain-containing protein [Mycolicibacterium palauense]